jgi:hypothetical protein
MRKRERADYFCDGKTENTLCLGDAFCFFSFCYIFFLSSCKSSFRRELAIFTADILWPHLPCDLSLNAHWRAPSSEHEMSITVLQLLCLSPPASVLLRHYAPALSLGVISTPIVLFLALFVAKITWAVVIYPKFFSALRHLPTPDDNAFFSGQTKRVFREAGGRPMRHWIETVKNDGLIAYSVWFRERVLVTDPKTLGEVLVTKVGFLCCCEM